MSLLLLGAAGTPGPVTPAGVQPLRADGKIFRTVDGSPWRWRGVSAFQLLDRFARGEDLDPFLRAYRGFNLLRVWPYVPAADWGDRAWSVTDPVVIRAFVVEMARRGWYVELTLLTDDDPLRLEWAELLIPQLLGLPGLLLEAGNEPTAHKAINTPALKPALDASGLLYASGDYEDSARAFGPYLVAHTARDAEWPRRAHDALEYFSGGGPNAPSDPAHRCPVVLDEPAKLEDVSGDRVVDWLGYFAAASLLAAGATFHSQTGKFAQPPTDAEAMLAAVALKGLTAFPADAPLGAYQHGAAERDDEAATGSLRTYRVGAYGVRVRPRDPSVTPILLGV